MKLGNQEDAEDAMYWFAEGVRDFNDGALRTVPVVVFRYARPVPLAQAWYRGWDIANLATAWKRGLSNHYERLEPI